MRDIQDSKIYVELLRLLSERANFSLPSVQFIDLLCERESVSLPDFLKVNSYERTSVYHMVGKLEKMGLIARVPLTPTPEDFEDWGTVRKRKWGRINRGAIKYRITLETALNAIDSKVLALTEFRERLVKLKEAS